MFVNSSSQCRLADNEFSSLHLTHIPPTRYSKQNDYGVTIDLLLHYTQDHFLSKMLIVAKSPYRHAEHKPDADLSRDASM